MMDIILTVITESLKNIVLLLKQNISWNAFKKKCMKIFLSLVCRINLPEQTDVWKDEGIDISEYIKKLHNAET